MNYLLDKKIKKKRFLNIAFFIVTFLVLFYFKSGIFNKFSYVTGIIFHPILILGNGLEGKFESIGAFFTSKNSLYQENQDLQSQLNKDRATMSNYNSVLAENIHLKEILGRKDKKTGVVLAAILSKPNQSLYDTLVIDAGTKEGIKAGNIIFAFGNVPIGRVLETYANSSKVILFSSAGEKTQVIIDKAVFMEIIGRGGGNFEIIIPRDFTIQKGDEVVLPGITPHIVATVVAIISDPRDSFQKALLTSPVNIQELKFVEVEY